MEVVRPSVDSTVWIWGDDDWEEASVTKLNEKSFRVDGVDAVLKYADHGVTWSCNEPVEEEEEEEAVETAEAAAEFDPTTLVCMRPYLNVAPRNC